MIFLGCCVLGEYTTRPMVCPDGSWTLGTTGWTTGCSSPINQSGTEFLSSIALSITPVTRRFKNRSVFASRDSRAWISRSSKSTFPSATSDPEAGTSDLNGGIRTLGEAIMEMVRTKLKKKIIYTCSGCLEHETSKLSLSYENPHSWKCYGLYLIDECP